MPVSKSRINKRSSSNSYASTITTVVFVALCVLGVWMLTSNSVVPPQATSRFSSTAATSDAAVFSSSNENRLQIIKPASDKKEVPVFEDNPGDLPDDAIKSDEPKDSSENNKPQEEQHDEQENGDTVKNGGSVVEENRQGIQGKESAEEEKQKERETQISEESTLTQNQQAEQTKQKSSESEENQQSSDGDSNGSQEKTTEPGSNDNSQGSESDKQKPDEEQEAHDIQVAGHGGSQGLLTQALFEDQEQHKMELQQQQQLREDESHDSNEVSQINQKVNVDQQQQQPQQQDLESHPSSQEPQNVISDEDQQQRIQQQHQHQLEQQQQKPKEQSDTTLNNQQQQQQQRQQTSQIDQVQNATTHGSQEKDGDQQQNQKSQQTLTYVENQEIQKSQQESQQNESSSTQDQAKQETNAAEDKAAEPSTTEAFPAGASSGIPKESKESKRTWSTQADESESQKERRKDEVDSKESIYGYTWHLCNVTAASDYIPCLDNEDALKHLKTTKHYEHRERHCPKKGPTCLVRLPEGYKSPIAWPQSRDKVWYHNVPHTKLAEVKGHQNWVKVTGEFLTFPGGGTQFIHGALHYIDFLEQSVPNIEWGKHTRVILDVGCGVASFGGYLFERDVLTMSFAPKDEHEAQVQFALERGIPAISAVMGSQRLPFPSRVFDLLHCARCRVPWHERGGMLLLELNRILRPGGYFVWSATPVYQKHAEDVEIWKAMSALTVSMCWELVTIQKDKLNKIGAAIFRKPTSNECYDQRNQNSPPMCKNDDDPNAAWYVPLQACMHRVPVGKTERGTHWPENWPARLQVIPYWLNKSQMGIYGKPAPQDFAIDYEHWKRVVTNTYMSGLGISWSNVRNVMDMRAVYGGFAAALKDLPVWVLNVVNVDSPDTLPIIYERGLFGIYHDWCESFSTYPRTYDLLHADHLFSKLKKRCELAPVMAEVDRIVRPQGKLIVRDESSTIGEVDNLLKSLHWEVHLTFSKDQEGILSAQKGDWRPKTAAAA